MYRAAILDVDGTLVASNDAHARAWVDAIAEHGVNVKFETIRPLIGMGSDKLLPRAAGISASSSEGKATAERWDDRALAGAIAIYDDPQDLLDSYDLSPFKRPLPALRS